MVLKIFRCSLGFGKPSKGSVRKINPKEAKKYIPE